jgi:hypothetical protein
VDFNGLLINLLSSAIAFICGFVGKEALRRFRRRWFLKVWQLEGKSASIFVGEGPRDPLGDLPSVYEADINAAMTTQRFLQGRLLIEDVEILSSRLTEVGSSLKKDLVVIGGPTTNSIARRLDEALDPPYYWEYFPQFAKIHLKNDGLVFAQEIRDDRTFVDYAAVILARNPFNCDRRIVSIAGCGSAGTSAAALFLMGKEMKRLRKRIASRGTYCIILKTLVAGNGGTSVPEICKVIEYDDPTRYAEVA